MTTQEFTQRIKEKYPAYKDVPDADLVSKMLEKYPVYKDRIDGADYKMAATTQQSTQDFTPIQEFPKQQEPGILSKIGSVAKGVGTAIISSEKGFGESLGAAWAASAPSWLGGVKDIREKTLQDNLRYSQEWLQRAKKEINPEKKKSMLKNAMNAAKGIAETDIFQQPEFQKSAKQIYGEALGVVTDIASAGTYGAASKGAKARQIFKPLVTPVAQTAGKAFLQGAIKEGTKGTIFGASQGVANAMQKDKEFIDITKSALTGGAIGGAMGGILGGWVERGRFIAPQKAEALKQKAVEQYKKGLNATKEKYQEIGDKIIPDLMDQGIWGTRRGLIKKAEKGVQLANSEYEKIGQLQGLAEIDGVTGKIDDMMSKLKAPSGAVISTNTTQYRALQSLKDDVLAYQVIDDAIKNPSAYQEGLRQLRQNYDEIVYAGRKSLKTVEESQKLGPVKDVADSIRDLLATKNPEYAKVNKLYSTNSKLAEVLEATAQRQASNKVVGLIDSVWGAGGMMVGALSGTLSGAAIGGAALVGLHKMLNSTWWNTLRAVQKNQLAEKILVKGAQNIPLWIQMVANGGAKMATQLLKQP